MGERPTFAERFLEGETTTIEHDGDTIHSVIELPVERGGRIQVERISTGSGRPQGVVLGIERGDLRVGDVTSRRITLWSDTAPERVEVVVAAKRPTIVRAWNTWRDDEAAESAWLGWAAMRSERIDDQTVRIACSDRFEPPDFTDLVVDI
ncbi:MAG: hypothetical protein ACE5GB_06065, partial [Acidimicrobiales bacterium]